MVGDAQWRPEQHLSPIALKDGEALANSVAAWYAKLSDEQRKVALVIIGAALAEAGARGPNCGELATVVSACAKSGCAFVWMAAASPDRDFLHPGTRSDSAATPAGRGFGGFGGFGGVDVIHSFPEPPVAEQPTEEPELLREESPRKPSGDLPPFAPRH
jgi:hypothetical protein